METLDLHPEELFDKVNQGLATSDEIARVDAHLASCATCSAELALIQAARRAVRGAPSIDVARISAGVVAATLTPSRPQLVANAPSISQAHRAPRMRWIGMKAAAAVAIAAAGIASFAVWHSTDDGGALPNGGTVAAIAPASDATAPTSTSTTAAAPVVIASATPQTEGSAEITVAGGLSDLSASDLKALLGDLGSTAGAADDAAFEDPAPVIPDVGDIGGGESL